MFYLNESESAAGAGCVKNLVLLKGETEVAFESSRARSGGHNGRRRAGGFGRVR